MLLAQALHLKLPLTLELLTDLLLGLRLVLGALPQTQRLRFDLGEDMRVGAGMGGATGDAKWACGSA